MLESSLPLLFCFRASLTTPFFQWIPIFLRENELISLEKVEISWKNVVAKLDLNITSMKFHHHVAFVRDTIFSFSRALNISLPSLFAGLGR